MPLTRKATPLTRNAERTQVLCVHLKFLIGWVPGDFSLHAPMGPPPPPPVAPTLLASLLPSSPVSLPLGTHLVPPGDGTLQAALNSSSSGDELLLADGIYTGAELIIGWNVTIRAQNVGQVTVDGGHSHAVINIQAGTINLCGLTIANGTVVSDGLRVSRCPNSTPPHRSD